MHTYIGSEKVRYHRNDLSSDCSCAKLLLEGRACAGVKHFLANFCVFRDPICEQPSFLGGTVHLEQYVARHVILCVCVCAYERLCMTRKCVCMAPKCVHVQQHSFECIWKRYLYVYI